MASNTKVLVTAGRFHPATAVARAFHRAGAGVDIADSCRLSPALHSSAADALHIVAPPAGKPAQFMIECNPRCSAGAFLIPADWLGEAVLGNPDALHTVEPGHRRQYDLYLLNRHMTHLSAHRLVHELLTTPDAYMAADDILPALYFLISRRHWSEVAKREHVDVGQAFMRDITWDGSPMPDDDSRGPSSMQTYPVPKSANS